MQINRKVWEALSPALSELKRKINCDFVVFGSASLYLWGVLPFEIAADLNDLDIAVGDDFVPFGEMREVLFHNDPRQKLYKISTQGINIDIGAAWPGREKIYEKIFNSAVEVEGFKFAGLDVVREWKEMMIEEYGREKDRNHLARIQEYQRRKKEEIKVSGAAVEDVENILKLKDEVWVAAYVNKDHSITAEDIRGREDKSPERLARMRTVVQCGDGLARVWIAKDGEEIVGMCSADKGEKMNILSALYVLPSYQRMGVGCRLLEKAFAWLGGEKPISLEVVEYNADAIVFYKRCGFEITGDADSYIFPGGKQMPLLEMIKYFRE